MDPASFRTCTWSGRWNGISTKWQVDKMWRRQKIDHFWQPKKNPLPQLPLFNRFLLKLRLRVKTRKTQEIARKREKSDKSEKTWENAWKNAWKRAKMHENASKRIKMYENSRKRTKTPEKAFLCTPERDKNYKLFYKKRTAERFCRLGLPCVLARPKLTV